VADIDFDQEAARVSEHADRVADQARERFAQVGKVTGKAEASDGSISVEVNPGGLLAEIHLTRSALRFGSDSIAEQIMELSNQATRRAGDKMYQALAPVLGESGAKHLQSLGFEPMPDDEPHVTTIFDR
jgi:hypothetical protein